jgi:hypothetical protein
MSDVNVFGLKSRAERVLFAVDASKAMLVDEKGGLFSYQVIKDEISSMVSNLSAGTLFNVAFFERGRIKFFKPRPVPAGSAVTQELMQWISPINADINSLGIGRPEHSQSMATLADHNVFRAINSFGDQSSNEDMKLTQIFLEQAIDAAFIITGSHSGISNIRRLPTAEEGAALAAENAAGTKDSDYDEKMKVYKKAEREALAKARKKLDELNKKREARGLPPKVLNHSILKEFNIKIGVKKPDSGKVFKRFEFPAKEVEDYLDLLVDTLYTDRGTKPPSINVVLFLAGDEELSEKNEDKVKDYVRFFDGKHRVIRGLNEIKFAASATDTKN